MKNPAIVVGGLASVLLFHGVLLASYLQYADGRVSMSEAMFKSEKELQRRRLNLCGKQRCPRVEGRKRRRKPEEPPVEDLDILTADLVPALGGVAPDPKALPELEAFHELEKVEDAINLENQDPKLEKLIKKPDPKKLDNPLDRKSDLAKLLEDYENDDPRVNRKKLEELTGYKDGEIGGSGMERRLGNIYSRKAARAISREFKLPPFIDQATLKKLKMRVRVTKLSFDGSIEAYRIVSKSGDRSFDDAALAAVKRFSSKDGGSKRLPPPDAKVLRYINKSGLVITMDGRLAR